MLAWTTSPNKARPSIGGISSADAKPFDPEGDGYLRLIVNDSAGLCQLLHDPVELALSIWRQFHLDLAEHGPIPRATDNGDRVVVEFGPLRAIDIVQGQTDAWLSPSRPTDQAFDPRTSPRSIPAAWVGKLLTWYPVHESSVRFNVGPDPADGQL